jgi:hypothetical protein
MREVSEFELKRKKELEAKGFSESYKPPKSAASQTLPQPANFKIEPLDGGASLTWDAVPGAESYHVYISDDGRRFRRCINQPLQNTSIIIGDLENGKMYYFAIAPQGEILEGTKAVRTVVPTRQMTKDQ